MKSTACFSFLCIVFVLIEIGICNDGQFRLSLKKCKAAEDKKTLEACIKNEFGTAMREVYLNGDATIGLPSLEGSRLGTMKIKDQGTGGVRMNANLEMVIYGLSDFSITDLDINPEDRSFTISMLFPEQRYKGLYNLDGSVFNVPVHGNGTYWASFGNLAHSYSAKIHTNGSNIELENTFYYFSVERPVFRLNNLFADSPIIAEALNVFLNEVSQEMLKEVKPQMNEQYGEFYTRIMNNILKHINVEDLPI